MIELRHLSKIFSTGITALDDINLSIQRGEIFGVIGPSGAGKSTLIRCVNLIEQPSAGQVIIDKQDLTSLRPSELRAARKKIGMIFQHFNLLSSRTVYNNIAFPLEISGHSKNEIANIIHPLLELTGLTEKKDFYPSELSGGQKQRVAIARALTNKPHVLLSDEATSALDPHTTHSILQLLKNINEELGVTILLITHEMEVVKEICHRLAIIEHGKIIEESNVLEFFIDPKTDTAKKFIRSTIRHKLPEAMQKRISNKPETDSDILLRLSFLGKTAQEPLIANLIKVYAIDINIIQANIEVIRDEITGVTVVQISDRENNLQAALEYLREKGVHVEVIGYVKRND